jgi:Putative auto-transporter adhesin, head GIN domain
MRVLAAAAVLVLVAGCGGGTKGSGHLVTVHRDVGGFSRIELDGAGTVTVTVGAPAGLTIYGDDNIVPLITTNVVAGALVISSKHSYTTHDGLEIRVSTPALDAASIDGAGTFRASRIRATSFSADLSGTGTLDLDGTVGRLDTNVSGVGSALLEHLVTQDARVTLDGTGTVRVHVTGTLDAAVNGVGSIVYRGHPRVVHAHVSGIGTIAAG